MERDGAHEPLSAVERQDGVQRSGQRPHRERPQRDGCQDPGAEQRIEVGAVVGVPVADEHGVERRRALGGQGGGHAVSGVDQQAESVVVDEVAAARLARARVGATSPDDGELHPRRIGIQSGSGVRPAGDAPAPGRDCVPGMPCVVCGGGGVRGDIASEQDAARTPVTEWKVYRSYGARRRA